MAGIYASGPDEMSAFQAGALDAGYVGMAPAMLAVANGKANAKGAGPGQPERVRHRGA